MIKLEKFCLVLISIALLCQAFINFKIIDEVKTNKDKIKELEEVVEVQGEDIRILEHFYWDLYYMGVSSYDGEYEYYE